MCRRTKKVSRELLCCFLFILMYINFTHRFPYRLVIPPVLAYGATGVPRRGIPPNATLQYDVTLVSMNGLATPQ